MDHEMVKDLIEAATKGTNPSGTNTACPDEEQECCCPNIVLYFIWTKCLTINNGACPDWEFCKPGRGC